MSGTQYETNRNQRKWFIQGYLLPNQCKSHINVLIRNKYTMVEICFVRLPYREFRIQGMPYHALNTVVHYYCHEKKWKHQNLRFYSIHFQQKHQQAEQIEVFIHCCTTTTKAMQGLISRCSRVFRCLRRPFTHTNALSDGEYTYAHTQQCTAPSCYNQCCVNLFFSSSFLSLWGSQKNGRLLNSLLSAQIHNFEPPGYRLR